MTAAWPPTEVERLKPEVNGTPIERLSANVHVEPGFQLNSTKGPGMCEGGQTRHEGCCLLSLLTKGMGMSG